MNKDEKVEVSIIIPFYNRYELLKETLNSIKSQTFDDYEVLIIDDYSDDFNFIKASEIVDEQGDKRFRLYKKPEKFGKGANSSRNFGFKESQGKYVKWFDSDDVMLSSMLGKQYSTIEKYNLDGIFSGCGIYNEDFTTKIKSSWRKLTYSESPLKDYLKTQLAWQTGSGLWKKSSLSKINPFVENLNNAQEWIFHLFILTSNMKIGVVDEELYKIRSHEKSISTKKNKSYVFNRFKARTMALSRLIETKNSGKRYLIKSLINMMRKSDFIDYPKFFGIFLNNLNFKFPSRTKSTLIKINK